MSFGRLERTPSPQPMSEINMTPLIDVMLVLLVIFIITAPLLTGTIKLALPKSDSAPAAPTSTAVTLVVDGTGQVYLNDRPVAMDVLNTRLMQTAQVNPDTEVQLRADAAVPYGRIVEIMSVAQKAGLNHIGFVAESKPSTTTVSKP